MHYTANRIANMSEADLCSNVLLRLFPMMGFQGVRMHGGGSLEQGKDIVMWKTTELGNRINFAVVVKATSINGRAKGRSSAAEVVFQINQCFGNVYLDSATLSEHQINRVWVVCSQEITKEALYSVKSALPKDKANIVEFIDGTKLSELVERHRSSTHYAQSLSHVIEKFKEVVEDFRSLEPIPNAGNTGGVEKSKKKHSVQPAKTTRTLANKKRFLVRFLNKMDRIWAKEFDEAWRHIRRHDYEMHARFSNTLDRFFIQYWTVFNAFIRDEKDDHQLQRLCNRAHKESMNLASDVWAFAADSVLQEAGNLNSRQSSRKLEKFFEEARREFSVAQRLKDQSDKIAKYKKITRTINTFGSTWD